MQRTQQIERVETLVIGAGQAGLAVAYHLAQRGRDFVVLEANARVGDSWRRRWDSLRLFTPARYDSIDGLPFPAPPFSFPTKDEMADYLEGYVRHFDLPVRTGVRVERVSREGDRYIVRTDERTYETAHVVIAMANYQRPRVPSFASELANEIVQLHSTEYRNPTQLRQGGVLVVGAGNSGAEIAIELARLGRRVALSGKEAGQVPFRVDGTAARLLLSRLMLRGVFHHLLTLDTPMGRRVHASGSYHATPLIRVKSADLAVAGVERVARVAGVRDGRPLLDGERTLDVPNVIWATGFEPGFSFLDLPVFGADGRPVHSRGVAVDEPGLYFVGLHFLYAMSSPMIHGVSRDAAYIADRVVERAGAARRLEAEVAA